MEKLFANRISFDLKLEKLLKGDVVAIHYRPVLVKKKVAKSCSESEANAFGIYLVFSTAAINKGRHNPTQWVADLDTLKSADGFARLLAHVAQVPYSLQP